MNKNLFKKTTIIGIWSLNLLLGGTTYYMIDNNISISSITVEENPAIASLGVISLNDQTIPLIEKSDTETMISFCKEYDQLYATTDLEETNKLSFINLYDPCATKKINGLIDKYINEKDYYLSNDTFKISGNNNSRSYRMIAIKNIEEGQAEYYTNEVSFENESAKVNFATQFITGADKVFYSMIDPTKDLAYLMIHNEDSSLKTVILVSQIS